MQQQSDKVQTIDEYIAQYPEDIREILTRVRAVIRQAAPEASEAIKYMMPTFVLNGNLVHFAAQKKHLGFYPSPSGIVRFKDEISQYVWSKGAVQFPYDKPIPYDLIRRITEFRVSENQALKRKK